MTKKAPMTAAEKQAAYRERDPERTRRQARECWHRHRLSKMDQRLAAAAKKRAKKHGLPFSITGANVIIPKECPVLGIPLDFSGGKQTDASPTLDRIIPELGYVPGNVAVISLRANRIKSNASLTEIRKVARWMGKHCK